MEKPEIVKPLLSCLLSIQGLYASDATATFAVGFFDFCEFETKEYEKNFQRILGLKGNLQTTIQTRGVSQSQ